tara:strand:- start:458 stop:610 length:153 start_codon:yes stop_codon:yes gene_type:complete
MSADSKRAEFKYPLYGIAIGAGIGVTTGNIFVYTLIFGVLGALASLIFRK